MAMGRRDRDRQEDLFVCPADLPTASHPFYARLNGLLAEGEFDAFVEAACAPYYDASSSGGRPSIPPGVYFRMLFVGYFEGIDSQRGIAWRCNDSLALRGFLGVPLTERTPDHSSLTRIRDRLPEAVADKVFQFMLRLARAKGLSASGTVGVDSTTLEANAAMKGIVRRDNGDDYKAFLRKLAAAEGIENPNDEELRRFDRKRRDKKCSNEEWVSPADGDAEITKMKDGRTHLAYKAEHVVDLESGLLLAAEVLPATQHDSDSLVDSVLAAQQHLDAAATLQPTESTRAQQVAAVGKGVPIDAAAADKGYHAAKTLELAATLNLKTYIPEPERRGKRSGKPAKKRARQRRLSKHSEPQRRAAANNRRRMQRAKGKRLQRRRSEVTERSFAHLCDTGGARRTWLRGFEKIGKRYSVHAAAFNLGLLMRHLFGIGKPRVLQGLARALAAAFLALAAALARTGNHPTLQLARRTLARALFALPPTLRDNNRTMGQRTCCSTGC